MYNVHKNVCKNVRIMPVQCTSTSRNPTLLNPKKFLKKCKIYSLTRKQVSNIMNEKGC